MSQMLILRCLNVRLIFTKLIVVSGAFRETVIRYFVSIQFSTVLNIKHILTANSRADQERINRLRLDNKGMTRESGTSLLPCAKVNTHFG